MTSADRILGWRTLLGDAAPPSVDPDGIGNIDLVEVGVPFRPARRKRFVNGYASHMWSAMIATIATAAIPNTQYGQIVSRPSGALPFQ